MSLFTFAFSLSQASLLALLPLRATTMTQDKQVTVDPYKRLFQSLVLDHTNRHGDAEDI